MKKAKLLEIPHFKTEDEEREFWETHDSTDYVDWSTAEFMTFPNLKPSTTTISLRLPISLLDRIKTEANKLDIPYQSLIKMWLATDLTERIGPTTKAPRTSAKRPRQKRSAQ